MSPIPTSPAPKPHWTLRLPRRRTLALGPETRVMGVVNVTPDSFSDGGRFLDPKRAVDHGLELLEQGADLLDLGAESTRPGGGVYGDGAATVPVEEEWRRLEPVLTGLRRATDAPLSIDTRKGEVARRALDAGADLINDISNLRDDDLGRAVAAAGCPLILMHSRGELGTMQRDVHFDDLLAEVRADLEASLERATALGVAEEQIILDPGIGFGKTAQQNLALLARVDHLQERGRPVLIGASRKSFLGRVTGGGPRERLPGSLVAATWTAHRGVALVRVHDVAETVQALATWRAIATQTLPPAAGAAEAEAPTHRGAAA